jgi:hypothetical protein
MYSWNEATFFGQFLCPSSGVLHCTHSNGISHTEISQMDKNYLCMYVYNVVKIVKHVEDKITYN